MTYDGVELDSTVIVMSSPKLSQFRFTTPAVSIDITSVVVSISDVATGNGDSFSLTVKPQLPAVVDTWFPAMMTVRGGTVNVVVLYFMETLTDATVINGDISATIQQGGVTTNVAIISSLSPKNTNTRSSVPLAIPTSGINAGAGVVTIRFTNSLGSELLASFTMKFEPVTLPAPLFNKNIRYEIGSNMVITLPSFSDYFADPAHANNAISATFTDSGSGNWAAAQVSENVKGQAKAVSITVPTITIDTAQMLNCTLTATGMSDAQVQFMFEPPRVASLVAQSKTEGTQNGGEVVVVEVVDLFGFGKTSELYVDYDGQTVSKLKMKADAAPGKYRVEFVTMAVVIEIC